MEYLNFIFCRIKHAHSHIFRLHTAITATRVHMSTKFSVCKTDCIAFLFPPLNYLIVNYLVYLSEP